MAHLGGLGGGGEGGVGGGGLGGDGGGGLHRQHNAESDSALTPKQRAVLGRLIFAKVSTGVQHCETHQEASNNVLAHGQLAKPSKKRWTGKEAYLGGLGGGGTGGEGGGGLHSKMQASGRSSLLCCMLHSHGWMCWVTKIHVNLGKHERIALYFS